MASVKRFKAFIEVVRGLEAPLADAMIAAFVEGASAVFSDFEMGVDEGYVVLATHHRKAGNFLAARAALQTIPCRGNGSFCTRCRALFEIARAELRAGDLDEALADVCATCYRSSLSGGEKAEFLVSVVDAYIKEDLLEKAEGVFDDFPRGGDYESSRARMKDEAACRLVEAYLHKGNLKNARRVFYGKTYHHGDSYAYKDLCERVAKAS